MSRDHGHRLGRGLAALLGEPVEDGASSEIQRLAVTSLDPNPLQPRGPIDIDSLADLIASVRAQGILQPLLVRPHAHHEARFEIVAGERRWRAAIAAEITQIPCLVLPLDDRQSVAAALVENLQRLDLNALEEAHGYDRLQTQFGITQDDVAEAVGKSRSHIANTLRLLKLPDPLKLMVRAGTLSAGHARALLTHPNAIEAAHHVIARGLSVRQTEALAERVEVQPKEDFEQPSNADTAAIEKELADQLGLAVRIRAKNGRGSLTLRFTRLEQLDLLIARLAH